MKEFAHRKQSQPLTRYLIFIVTITVVVATGIIVRTSEQRSEMRAKTSPVQRSEPLSRTNSGTLMAGKISFVRDRWIYLMDLSTKKETKLTIGFFPKLSPQGESLVFLSPTESEDPDQLIPSTLRLRHLKLEPKTEEAFSSMANAMTGNPVWSPDGLKIAVGASDNETNGPFIAVLDVQSGKVEKKITTGWDALRKDESLYLDMWTPKGNKILFHTLSALYQVDVNNGSVQKMPVGELLGRGNLTSSTQFSLSADQRYLLFDGFIDTPEEPDSQIVSVFDFTTKTVRRVTPKDVHGRAPVWFNNQILFSRVEYKERWVSSICLINSDGTGLKTVVENADYASYAAK